MTEEEMEQAMEEEGMRLATLRAEEAATATTETAAAANAAALEAAAIVMTILETATATESVARGKRRNKMCASAAVGHCRVINGTINDTVETRCMQCEELLHGVNCAHSWEDLDEYTCWKPKCRGKHAKKELSDFFDKRGNDAYVCRNIRVSQKMLEEKEKRRRKTTKKKPTQSMTENATPITHT
mmetsp:Transcript_42356/g.45982  ORF Transcript_42356/g.45982 Transcript_42356/m.45982 type:complete len:185 (-) Transcript_42356:405-959(-)